MADSVKSQIKSMKSGEVLEVIFAGGFKDCANEIFKEEGCPVLEMIKKGKNIHFKVRIK